MNTKTVAIVALAIAGVGFYAAMTWRGEKGNESPASPMRVGENAVVVLDQRPGSTVTIAETYLENPGYVVIHEEKEHSAGAILGASEPLGAGVHRDVHVQLTRPSREGETLYAMLHKKGNSASFSAASDAPIENSLGPIMGSFEIRSSADENVQIQL